MSSEVRPVTLTWAFESKFWNAWISNIHASIDQDGSLRQKMRTCLLDFSVIRQDHRTTRILKGDPRAPFKYHQYCYDQYTHSKTLKSIQEKESDGSECEDGDTSVECSERRASSRKKNRGGKKSGIYVKGRSIRKNTATIFPGFLLSWLSKMKIRRRN